MMVDEISVTYRNHDAHRNNPQGLSNFNKPLSGFWIFTFTFRGFYSVRVHILAPRLTVMGFSCENGCSKPQPTRQEPDSVVSALIRGNEAYHCHPEHLRLPERDCLSMA